LLRINQVSVKNLAARSGQTRLGIYFVFEDLRKICSAGLAMLRTEPAAKVLKGQPDTIVLTMSVSLRDLLDLALAELTMKVTAIDGIRLAWKS
jgi:hypothetical protein